MVVALAKGVVPTGHIDCIASQGVVSIVLDLELEWFDNCGGSEDAYPLEYGELMDSIYEEEASAASLYQSLRPLNEAV